jgi:hypothetical protein
MVLPLSLQIRQARVCGPEGPHDSAEAEVNMRYTQVDIGIRTSYDFFFEVAWPNYHNFVTAPSIATAVNASMALWHMRDWRFRERQPDGSHPELTRYTNCALEKCPELGWLRDIAESGKHLVLHRSSASVKTRAMSAQQHGTGLGMGPISSAPIGSFVTELVIDVGGTTHNLHGVMLPVLTYWLGKVLPHDVEFSLAPDDLAERVESMIDWCRERLGDERTRKKKWTVLQGANAPHFIQRFAFLERDDAEAFKLRFGV